MKRHVSAGSGLRQASVQADAGASTSPAEPSRAKSIVKRTADDDDEDQYLGTSDPICSTPFNLHPTVPSYAFAFIHYFTIFGELAPMHVGM